jgi:hypothetical protein
VSIEQADTSQRPGHTQSSTAFEQRQYQRLGDLQRALHRLPLCCWFVVACGAWWQGNLKCSGDGLETVKASEHLLQQRELSLRQQPEAPMSRYLAKTGNIVQCMVVVRQELLCSRGQHSQRTWRIKFCLSRRGSRRVKVVTSLRKLTQCWLELQ